MKNWEIRFPVFFQAKEDGLLSTTIEAHSYEEAYEIMKRELAQGNDFNLPDSFCYKDDYWIDEKAP